MFLVQHFLTFLGHWFDTEERKYIDWFFRVPLMQQTACPVNLTSLFLLRLYDSSQFFKQEGIVLRCTPFGFSCTSNWAEGKRNVLVCLSPPFAFGTCWLSHIIHYIESRIKISNDIQWTVLGYLWRLSKCACCSCCCFMCRKGIEDTSASSRGTA